MAAKKEDISQGWQSIPEATLPGQWPGCEASLGKLVNACDYSFADLYRAACTTTSQPAEEREARLCRAPRAGCVSRDASRA